MVSRIMAPLGHLNTLSKHLVAESLPSSKPFCLQLNLLYLHLNSFYQEWSFLSSCKVSLKLKLAGYFELSVLG